MMPRLGEKYDIEIETISKPKAEYSTDEYFERDLPVAPAVTAAVHDAVGVWFNEFPLTPERVLRGLGKI